jgi:hypothetical protein
MEQMVEILELHDELHRLVSYIIIDIGNIDCEPIEND